MQASGELLDGRYRLDRLVATGGAGAVWRATDTVLGRNVAVKVLRGDAAETPSDTTRFLDEARALAALHHPSVVEVYDYGEADGVAYLVMAFVEGEPLKDLITRRGGMDATEAMPIIAGVARALAVVHRAGIVHRDVKPGNLILQPDGSAVLVDFGIAHQPQATHLTAADEVIGTPLYIAPEQVTKQPVTPATDVYALGAVAYHCLAGHPPFSGENPIAVALQHLSEEPPPLPPVVPASVAAVVATAMAKDPADRFPDAEAMADAADRSAFGTALTTVWLDRTIRAAPVTAEPTPAQATMTQATMTQATMTQATMTPATMAPARRRFPHGALAWCTTALALLAMVTLLIQYRSGPPIPNTPAEPLPGQTETVGPGVPVGDSDVEGGDPTPSPGPSGVGVPAATATPAPDVTPEPTQSEPDVTQPAEPTVAPTEPPAQPQVATTPATP